MVNQKIAVISDIHGNYDGLLAVLADIDGVSCGRVVCLGDLVDGGDGNNEVVRCIRDRGIATVRGNHDETNDCDLATDVRAYLKALPESLEIDEDQSDLAPTLSLERRGRIGALFTHISPRAKKNKISNEFEAWNAFDETLARIVFVGHAHIPMLFGERCGQSCSATDYGITHNVPIALDPSDRYIVCVGAVGYARDTVYKPRYAVYDPSAHTIEMRAVDGPVLKIGWRPWDQPQ